MMEFQGLTYVVKAKNSYVLASRSRGFIAFGRSGVELTGMYPLLFRAYINLLG